MTLSIAYYGSALTLGDGNWNHVGNWYSYPGAQTSNGTIPSIPLGRLPNPATDYVYTYSGDITTGPTGGWSGYLYVNARDFNFTGHQNLLAGSYSGEVYNLANTIGTNVTISGKLILGDPGLFSTNNVGSSYSGMGEPATSGNSIGTSSDGKTIIMSGTQPTSPFTGGTVWVCRDGGGIWRLALLGQNVASQVACSANGQYMVVINAGGYVYTSNDYGLTWVPNTAAGARTWKDVKMSPDGSKVIAVASSAYPYLSTNYGVTLTAQTGAVSSNWAACCISDDGTKAAAALASGDIYTYASGTWTNQTGSGSRSWLRMGCDSTCTNIVAGFTAGSAPYCATSSNSGVAWATNSTPQAAPSDIQFQGTNVLYVTSTAVGNYYSSNSGATLTSCPNPLSTFAKAAAFYASGASFYALSNNFFNNNPNAFLADGLTCTNSSIVYLQNGAVSGGLYTGLVYYDSALAIVAGDPAYYPTVSITWSNASGAYQPSVVPQDPHFLLNGGNFDYRNVTWNYPTASGGFFIQ